VESPSQAQRVAKQKQTFSAPFDIRACHYPIGAIVPFTFPPLGFVRQLFRVAEQEIGPGGFCNMTLSFETEEIYRWDADDRAPVYPATPVIYDLTHSALVQAVSEAGTNEVTAIATSSIRSSATITVSSEGGAAEPPSPIWWKTGVQ
jgi:hypothetical protein